MFHNHRNQDSIDPLLKKWLDLLRPTPTRDLAAIERGRARYQAEVDHLFGPQVQRVHDSLVQEVGIKSSRIGSLPSWFRAAIVGLVVIFIFVFIAGGAVLTVSASQMALPGDALYPIKTQIEQGQTRLSGNANQQVALHLEFAQHRLDEVQQLIDEKRFSEIPLATQEYQTQIGNAISALKIVAADNPEQASKLAKAFTSELSHYSQTLSDLSTSVPVPVRPDFDQALNVSQVIGKEEISADGQYVITGLVQQVNPGALMVYGRNVLLDPNSALPVNISVGQVVKVIAFQQEDGSLLASAITPVELLYWDTKGNPIQPVKFNGNINDNEARTGELNANYNGAGDYRNTNETANENKSDGRNDNTSSNLNSNHNTNDDNHNVNTNDSEQSGNETDNRNGNDSVNRNGNFNSNSNENESHH